MTHSFKLSRRIARLRVPVLAAIVLAAAACDVADPTEPLSTTDPIAAPTAAPAALLSAFRGGIPFGFFRMPTTAFGELYSGAKMTMGPNYILKTLRDAQARGGKVLIMLAGHENFYKDSRGHFSYAKWVARINLFKRVNLDPFINDGTIIAHYMIDEPQDVANWNGVPIPGATIEAMAKYSKSLWPKMITLVRAPPAKIKWSGGYRYLDAAWAQVENPRGRLNVNDFLNQNVAAARSQGLALAVGLNVTKGNIGHTKMTPTQVKSWGSVMLSSSYPCAFLSWQYDATQLSGSSMKDAMRYLRAKAQNRPSKSCRHS